MTCHARLGRRHSGIGRYLDRVATVAAVEPEPSDMMLMAEHDRLPRREMLLGIVVLYRDYPNQSAEKQRQNNSGQQRRLHQEVRSWAKDSHRIIPPRRLICRTRANES